MISTNRMVPLKVFTREVVDGQYPNGLAYSGGDARGYLYTIGMLVAKKWCRFM